MIRHRYSTGKENPFTDVIKDAKTGYQLQITTKKSDGWSLVTFFIPYKTSKRVGLTLVTSRDFQDYDMRIQNLKLSPQWQLIEVGAGLGGYIPRVIPQLRKPPIVIDPADYKKMSSMLGYASMQRLPRHIKERLEILTERCELYLSSGVTAINLTLGEALQRHHYLKCLADVVIDNAGATAYPFLDASLSKLSGMRDFSKTKSNLMKKVMESEQSLLKKNGRLVVNDVFRHQSQSPQMIELMPKLFVEMMLRGMSRL